MYLIYSLLYILVLPFILPVHLLKRPSHLRGRWLKERLGFVPSRADHDRGANKQGPTIWIHAVSVGEAMAARPLIKRLKEEANIVVSTVTDTGQKVVRDFKTDEDLCIYMPFDIPSTVKRTVERISPDIVLIMETELWPNLLRVVKNMGIPVVIVNGRVSDRSFKGYQRIEFFMKGMLGMIDYCCMQTERDAEKLIALGAPEERVCVTGNLKFDAAPPEEMPLWCRELSRPVIIAGSTHEGEEGIVLDAFHALRKVFRGATLIIAPRHPERFRDVEGLLRERGMNFGKRSDDGCRDKEVLLLDTIGELSSVYGCADICIIGGSLVPKGGHNLFEAACWAKPIVCGPYMENFPLAHDFFNNGAAVMVRSDNLDKVLQSILSDSSRAEEMGRIARELYFKNSGAVLKTLDVIDKLLPNRSIHR